MPGVCVVVMAKYPQAGAVKTRLAASLGEQVAADVARAFVLDLHARLAAADIRAAWAYWPRESPFDALLPGSEVFPQEGADLGERMAAAVSRAFAGGAPAAILLGADAPHVDLTAVAAAGKALESGVEVVIGPSEDGGYYLLGLRRPRPELFGAIAWGGPGVYAATLARCVALDLEPLLLPVTFDVDEPADLRRLARLVARGDVVLPATEAALVRAGIS